MRGNLATWAALTLASVFAAAFVCLIAALFAPGLPLFAGLGAASIGLAGGTTYAILALRDSHRRIEKLSQELTTQSQRLLRLESSLETLATNRNAGLLHDVEILTRVTTDLAEAVGDHDARLGSIARAMQKGETAVHASASPAADARAPSTSADKTQPAREAQLSSREDFAKAASAILGRLSGEPARILQEPADEAIVGELDAERVELWLLPIVSLPQRHVRFYVAQPHVMLPEGGHAGPEVIRPVLSRRRRIERLDALTLTRAMLVAGRLAQTARDTAIVLQISRAAFGNDAFVEGMTARLRHDAAAASRIVIDIAHAEAGTFSALEIEALARLRACGARLSLSDVPSLDLDWSALKRRGYSQVMLDTSTILEARPHATTAFLVAEAARAGLALAACGVDHESRIPDLLDFDVPLACGPALAPARPVRAEAPAIPSRAEVQEEAPSLADGGASFRDFLRRAG